MSDCICNSCKNLKGIVDDNGEINEYACEHGFPSDSCKECEVVECGETCSHYISDELEDTLCKVACKKCGKELEKVADDQTDGDVYCISCYMQM
ncbi:MAG: hypothetical protein N3B21_11700 [Clostridia bacterium]|nr:hypothetical protein [Clostridia bacterium]